MNIESFVSDHRRVEERSLRLHEAIAEKLRTNPEPVLRRARANIERARSDPHSASYTKEWDRLLRGPLDELIAVMVDDGEYARSLRQASPFAGALSPQERWAVYRAFEEEWTHATR